MALLSKNRSPRRRRFLKTITGATTALAAGCLSRRDSGRPGADDSPKTEATSSPSGTVSKETQEKTPSRSTSWSLFGHDVRNTGYAPTVTGPSSDPDIKWRYDAGTPTMNASPVVVDGTVYVPGSGDPGFIHAIDAATGETQWQFEPAGYATSAPAVVGDTLYIGTWGKQFYALDTATGDPRWVKDIGHRFGPSSPVVADGTVYVGTIGDGPLRISGREDEKKFEASAVLALDAETGTLRWQYRDFGERENVNSSPAIADGRVFFGGESALYALDAASGEEAWTQPISTHPDSSPAVVDGVVYYGAPLGGDRETPARLWALDAATGETVWTAGIDDVSLRTSPAVADGTVYVAASSTRICEAVGGDDESNCSGVTRGRLYAVDATTGKRRWMAEIKTDTRSSPAVADGVVYVGCRDGLSAITTAGETAWRVNFEGDRDDDHGPYVKSSPAVADGRVFIGASDGRLRAITTSATTGEN